MLALPFSCSGLVEDDLSRCIDVVPGGEYPMKIRLSNAEDKPLVVTLKQADYTYSATGENHFPQPGTLPRSNASWIEVQNTRIELAPNSRAEVHYVVRVPKKLDHQGSYWSLIFIEPETFHEVQSEATQIIVKVRYAYQIVTNIGQGTAKLDLVKVDWATNQEKPTLNIDVVNNGEVFLKPHLGLKIYDVEGKLVRNINGNEQKLLPETSTRFPVEIEGLAPASYAGLLLLRDGDRYFGKRFAFEVPQK